jgi:hypothetical protein
MNHRTLASHIQFFVYLFFARRGEKKIHKKAMPPQAKAL